MTKEHISFGSVESLHNKVKQANKKYVGEMEFGIKPKLHGTNASIVIEGGSGDVYAQSRKNVITPEKDNAGFATWVESLNVRNTLINGYKWVLYGEWAGQGIQSGDAVTQINQKAFFAICLKTIDPDGNSKVTHEPWILDTVLSMLRIRDRADVYIIPVLDTINISMNGDVNHLQEVEDKINSIVDEFETVDPYIKEKFGIEAPGEGVVVYPITESWDIYKAWMFKAKTKAHSVNKSKKAASAKVEVSPDVIDFAEKFATEPRFEQAISELGIDTDMKNMGKFLKWVNEDVIKESKDELEESELEWKQCAKQITNRARMWFMEQNKRIV